MVARALVDGITRSWNHADRTAYGENYWPTAELVGFDGEVFDGRAAIICNHIEMWNGPLKGSKIKGSVRRMRPVGASVLIVDVDLTSLAEDLPSPLARIKFVMEKRDAAWKIVSAQNTLKQ